MEEMRLSMSVSQLLGEAAQAATLVEKVRNLEQQLKSERSKEWRQQDGSQAQMMTPPRAGRFSARDLSRASTTDTVSGEEDAFFVAVFQAAFFLAAKDVLALGSTSECFCQAMMADFIWDAMCHDLEAYAGPRASTEVSKGASDADASSRTRILSRLQQRPPRFSTWSSVESGVEWKVSQRLLRSTGPGQSIRSPNFAIRGFSGYFLFYPRGAHALSRSSLYAVLHGAPARFEASLGIGSGSRGICQAKAGKTSFGWADAGPPFSSKTQRDALVQVFFSELSPQPASIEWCHLESS